MSCSRSNGSLYSFELSASARADGSFFDLFDFRNKPGEAAALCGLLPKSPIVGAGGWWSIEGGGLWGNGGGWSARENVKVVQLLRDTLSKSKLVFVLENKVGSAS